MKELEKYKEFYKQGIKNNRGKYMTMMEKEFNIPLLSSEEYNKKNPEVVELYKMFAKWI